MSVGIQFSNQYAPILTTPNEDIDHGDGSAIADFCMRVIIYVGMLVVVVMMVALILKFLGSLRGYATTEQVIATETDRLLSKETTSFTYGTSEEDEESGNCSNSLAEDLYDGKICVICYDEPRNCFFIPCGHYATCYVCAQRIVEGESKTCPVCRKFINKVRKLFIA